MLFDIRSINITLLTEFDFAESSSRLSLPRWEDKRFKFPPPPEQPFGRVVQAGELTPLSPAPGEEMRPFIQRDGN